MFKIFRKNKDTIDIAKRSNLKFLAVFVVAFIAIGGVFALFSSSASSLIIDDSLPTPQNVRTFGDDQNIIVAWDDVNDGRVVGYYITYKEKGSSDLPKVRQTIYDRIQLQPLINGTEYDITVQSVSGFQETALAGPLVHSGDVYQNHWNVGDGKVSPAATTSGTPSSARVDQMRQRLTGFFDDFNLPAGPFDELKWNQGPNGCVDGSVAGAFINPQYHSHNTIRSSCGIAGMASRPRATFDMSTATEQNPAQLEIDADGSTHGRDTWYVDLVPLSARPEQYPLDLTSHNDIFDLDNEDPGNMLRINIKSQRVTVAYYDTQTREATNLELTNVEPTQCGEWMQDVLDLLWCDYSVKTPGLSPLPQFDGPAVTVPNVRNQWVFQFTPTKIRLYVNGTHVGTANMPAEFFAEQKYTAHSTIFSYNTGKETPDGTLVPYIQLLHWDNFGFNGPNDNTVVHNYLEGQETGDKVAYSFGSEEAGNRITAGSRDTIIPVPDEIGDIKDDQAWLYMTLHPFGPKTWKWDPSNHVMFNGTRYDIPNPDTIVRSPIGIGGCRQYGEGGKSFSFAIPIRKSDIKTGNNNVSFSTESAPHACVPSEADILNVHLELHYDASGQIPDYTPPIEVFGDKFKSVVQPPLTNCDRYLYVEQDLGLPYHDNRANLARGSCFLMAGHNSNAPPVEPGVCEDQDADNTGGTLPCVYPEPAPDTTNPVVSITQPSDNQTVSGSVTIAADASDNEEVDLVSFYIDDNQTPFSTVGNAPFSVSWNTATVANGAHTIRAVATDTSGNVSQEDTVTVDVQNSIPDTENPTTSITTPASNTRVANEITITATANDNIGITMVELLIDGRLAATDTNAPYSFSLDTTDLSDGNHVLTTRAYDASGNNSTSAGVTIDVDNYVPPPVETCDDDAAENTGDPLPCEYPEPAPEPNPEPAPDSVLPGDVNGDGVVDVYDIATVLLNWNRSGVERAQGDATGDTVVNAYDVALVLLNWGRTK